MSFKLSQSATYHKDGDIIVVEIYIINEEDNTFVPNKLDKGTVQLFAGPQSICELDIDRRMGNSDGAIKAVFNHPPSFVGWQIKTDITLLVSGEQFSRTVPVVEETDRAVDDEIPLAEQPPTVNPGYLSQERIKENL